MKLLREEKLIFLLQIFYLKEKILNLCYLKIKAYQELNFFQNSP